MTLRVVWVRIRPLGGDRDGLSTRRCGASQPGQSMEKWNLIRFGITIVNILGHIPSLSSVLNCPSFLNHVNIAFVTRRAHKNLRKCQVLWDGWYLFISFHPCGLIYFPPLPHRIGPWTCDLKCKLVCKLYQWCARRHHVFISGRRGDVQRLLAAALHDGNREQRRDAEVKEFVWRSSHTHSQGLFWRTSSQARGRARLCLLCIAVVLLSMESKCRNL